MTVRILISSTVLVAALALSACATPREPFPSYGEQLDTLRQACAARGGILTPIAGATTGRPQTDNACEIRGGASRLN